MAFYLFPPRGTVPLEKLAHMTVTRMKFLLAVHHCHGNSAFMHDLVNDAEVVEDSDVLIEGSTKDDISHFSLRLACSQDIWMKEFFVEAETMLFAYRVSCMEEAELLHAIKPLRKLLTKVESSPRASGSLVDACHMILYILQGRGWSNLIGCYFNNSEEYMTLPFQYATELVAKRAVILHKGFAQVPVAKFCDLLVTLFRRLLDIGMAKAVCQSAEGDPRLSPVFHGIKRLFRKSGLQRESSGIATPVSADQVDEISSYFPLCMQGLHHQLRRSHRLPHHSRIRYTLFLKEAGLPLHEALRFWRQEYSLPGHGCGGCNHSWEQDGRRYTYNIRHLYGMEGSRTNYRGHTCSTIQNTCYQNDVGCPFRHFDSTNLTVLLSHVCQPDVEKLVTMAANEDYESCCRMYRNIQVSRSIDLTSEVKPVKAELEQTELESQKICDLKQEINTESQDSKAGIQVNQHSIPGVKHEESDANCKCVKLEYEPCNDDQERSLYCDSPSKSYGCRAEAPERHVFTKLGNYPSLPTRIHKPVDFFLSYENMLKKLKH